MNKNARIKERLLAQNVLLTAALAIDLVKVANGRSTAKKRRRDVTQPRVLTVWVI